MLFHHIMGSITLMTFISTDKLKSVSETTIIIIIVTIIILIIIIIIIIIIIFPLLSGLMLFPGKYTKIANMKQLL